MDRVSDEQLGILVECFDAIIKANIFPDLHRANLSALTELRDRRAKDAPCPEHAKMVAEWDAPGE